MVALIESPEETARASEALSPAEFFGTWCIGRVRGGQEVATAKYLEAFDDINAFVPTIQETYYRNDRKCQRTVTLIPSYVCICYGGTRDRYRLECNDDRPQKIYNIVDVRDQRRFATELDVLHRGIIHNAIGGSYRGLVQGIKCQVSAGPFQGTIGRVMMEGKRRKFIISVEETGSAYQLEIDGDLLEPLE